VWITEPAQENGGGARSLTLSAELSVRFHEAAKAESRDGRQLNHPEELLAPSRDWERHKG
jgi:hypothetical protein